MYLNQSPKSITILCPVFNEAENIERFYEKFNAVCSDLRAYRFTFIFTDNHSTDSSFEILSLLCKKNDNIKAFRFSKNFGYMKSIYTGLINSTDDACVIFDCDLQDPPELIIEFLEKWNDGYKVIYGQRSTRIEKGSLGNFRKLYRKFENIIKGYKVHIESGTWFLDRRVLDELRQIQFDPYLPGLITRLGFEAVGVPYNRRVREYGRAKGNFLLYLEYARDGLVSGTITPLRIVSVFGILISSISFLFMFYLIILKLFFNVPFASGVAALSAITLFGFGINFIFLGILGEYIGRIYMDKEMRSSAIIEQSCFSDNLKVESK